MRAHACMSRDGAMFACVACEFIGTVWNAIRHAVRHQFVALR